MRDWPMIRMLSALLVVALVALAGPAVEAGEDPKAEAARYFGLGNAAFDAGDYATAERMFRVCIALAPELAGPYRRLGQALKRLGRCSEALDYFLTYLKKRPSGKYSAQIREELAQCTVEQESKGLEVPMEPVASGTLVVEVDVPGAKVEVDGMDMGDSPIPPLSLRAGVHRIRVGRPGHYDAVRTVDLQGGRRLEVEIHLEPKPVERPAPAVAEPVPLELNVAPAGARVRVDGELVGLAPVKALALKPGRHLVEVDKAGFLPEKREVEVEPGSGRLTLDVRLMRLEGVDSTPDEPLFPEPPPGGVVAAPRPAPPLVELRDSPWAWRALAAGGTLLVLSGALGVGALLSEREYRDLGPAGDRRDVARQGETMALVADGLAAGGLVLSGIGAWLYLHRREVVVGGEVGP